MNENVTRRELAAMVEKLIEELEGHDTDYHHRTSARVLQDARSLLARWHARMRHKGTRPQ